MPTASDRDWAIRYGRPARLGGQPSRQATRLKQAGQDTYLLLAMLERLQRPGGPDSDGLRRISLQNFLIAGDKVRPAHRGGRPAVGEPAHPLSLRPAGRFAMRGDTRWAGTRLCDPCPSRSSCTRSREGGTVNFPLRHLRELQERNHEQQAYPDWLRAYGVRSGAGGTIAEFVGGHWARHCRYRGHAQTHTQHVLAAVAINIECLHAHELRGHRERQPTAFKKCIIGRELPIPHTG
jgi:hypothetical protein